MPIAAHARLSSGESKVMLNDGLVGSITGDKIIKGHIEGAYEQAETLGVQLAEEILPRGQKKYWMKYTRNAHRRLTGK